jgi:hypothetical protein
MPTVPLNISDLNSSYSISACADFGLELAMLFNLHLCCNLTTFSSTMLPAVAPGA